jgi:hypothetical protein
MGKIETISSKVRSKTGVPILSTPIQHSLEFLVRTIRQEEEIKGIQIDKDGAKLSLFAHDMILYQKIEKNSTQKLLDPINSFSKVAEYDVNLQKKVAFL